MDPTTVQSLAQQTAFRLAYHALAGDALRMAVNETVVGYGFDEPAEDEFRSVLDDTLALLGGAGGAEPQHEPTEYQLALA